MSRLPDSPLPLWEAAESAHKDFNQLHRRVRPKFRVEIQEGKPPIIVSAGHLKRYDQESSQDSVSFEQLQAAGSSSIVALNVYDGTQSNPVTISLVDTAAEDVSFERVPYAVQKQTIDSVAAAVLAVNDFVGAGVSQSTLESNEQQARNDLYDLSTGGLGRSEMETRRRRLAANRAMEVARVVHKAWNADNPERGIPFDQLTPRQQLEDLPYVRAGIRFNPQNP